MKCCGSGTWQKLRRIWRGRYNCSIFKPLNRNVICSSGRNCELLVFQAVFTAPEFPNDMSRNRFQNIRASLILDYDSDVDESTKLRDPLWTIRAMLIRLQKRAHELSVLNHASTLDEKFVRKKVRTTANCYITNKPDKFSVRFYCTVDWKTLYLHSIFDNGAGNTAGKNPWNGILRYFRPWCDQYTKCFVRKARKIQQKRFGRQWRHSKSNVAWLQAGFSFFSQTINILQTI